MSSIDISATARHLDSDLLRTFLAVADAGSISAGAEHIGRSQSAASLQIKRLEEIVGHTVFDRHGRGVVTTTVGEELRDVANHVVDLLDLSLGRLKSRDIAGVLRVGIPDEFGRDVLPHVLASYSRHHPNVELSVRCALSAEFPDALKRGELDIAVHDIASIAKGQKLLRRQPTVWATSRRHNPQARLPVPVALFDKDCWWRDAVIAALTRSGISYRIAYGSESVAGIIAAIESGIAVGAISEGSMRDDFCELGVADGFPKLPKSTLVLETRPGVDQALIRPMQNAIVAAFETG